MKFQNRYSKNPRIYEPPSGKSQVETAGYIPAQVKIESLINAGRRLIDSRKEQFDFAQGVEPDDNFFDPTRKKNLDRVDIDIMRTTLSSRIDDKIKNHNDTKKQTKTVEIKEDQKIPDDLK